jgi:asparaginyl-tRNA synthetase
MKNKLKNQVPVYNPNTHYLRVADSEYFHNLILLRNLFKTWCDFFWIKKMYAQNLDLFMLTPSVSSPMGPGSDSEAIEIQFGNNKTFLVDSSQFGFEPVLMNNFEKVYCYLPSMRGENPDKRHLNQFFHCEVELKGDLNMLIPQIEYFVKYLLKQMLKQKTLLKNLSSNYELSISKITNALHTPNGFRHIKFDEAVSLLVQSNCRNLINITDHGTDISSEGEMMLMKLMNARTPIWLTHFDRDRVPFYQKPDPANPIKVLNADLLFPPMSSESFGGEVVGAGQRQDTVDEMYESIRRQGLSSDPYEWYIDLRRLKNYSMTSGFGLGVERFLAWILNKDDIKDLILYPRIKNVMTYP